MTIERRYSLPNCTLILEGLSDGSTEMQSDMRPVISILLNAECHLTAAKEPLVGNRDFFVNLVRAVSAYAQEVLSKVRPPAENQASKGVHLHRIENNRHRLVVHSLGDEHVSTEGKARKPLAIDLTTVQLFDLVEAVDQFLADRQTLPDLSLKLTPVPKRHVASPPLAKQAAPAAAGVSSLALAAIAFFFVPIPEVQRPTQPQPQSNSSHTRFVTVPEISDPGQLTALKGKLVKKLTPAWKPNAVFNQDLVYRVGVTGNGAIMGYKAISVRANDAVAQTPLPQMLVNPWTNRMRIPEGIAQFQVVFSPQGAVKVSPWLK